MITVTSVRKSDTVPDNPRAIDATLIIGPVEMGEVSPEYEVTLLPCEDGSPGLATWGPSRDYWADYPLCSLLDSLEEDKADLLTDEIVRAVESASGWMLITS